MDLSLNKNVAPRPPQKALSWLGLFSKEAKILFLGLDNAGKSTLLCQLTNDTLHSLPPTVHPTSQEIILGNNVVCKTFDLGGHQQARRLWRDYFPAVNGIVFLVDAADPARFDEAGAELGALLSMPELEEVPVLVLGNKIDLPGAVNNIELISALLAPRCPDYGPSREMGDRILHTNVGESRVYVAMCSVVWKAGYRGGFEWLAGLL
ncbi:small COPII coat GTPase SAR1 [Podospora australis]|uniref:Small COPII coat GTPase SAR1 n=1 Tax=Podospora australis TaxID=1536484 RepID=A0AAN6WR79_9PEZI|nr:small COPII coat GTPase SAR1 [Podospora australis]